MNIKPGFLKKILLLPLAVSLLTSCSENEPQTAELKKDGSIEIVFETAHLGDTLDILKTIKWVYVKNNVVKEISEVDTIPFLGKETKEAENDEGEVQKVVVPKDYELFVTIK
jgi:hypothetical protein